MRFLVGYNGSEASGLALDQAGRYAKAVDASVYVVISMEGGAGEKAADIQKATDELEGIKRILKNEGVKCEVSQLARGLSPGEDLVRFAAENRIDHVFVGIGKRSRVGKLLLGSTAQYIILNAPCPVTTVKPRYG